MTSRSRSLTATTTARDVTYRGNHPTLGILVTMHDDLKHAVVVTQMMSGTSAAKIPQWRSRYRNSIIQAVDGEQITTTEDLATQIREARRALKETVEISFGRPQMSSMTPDGIPQLHFYQLNVIAYYLHAIRTGEDQWNQKANIKRTGDDDAYAWPPVSAQAIEEAVIKGLAIPKLSRKKLIHTKDWPKWRKSEWGQLTK
jgi:hypothetical protein